VDADFARRFVEAWEVAEKSLTHVIRYTATNDLRSGAQHAGRLLAVNPLTNKVVPVAELLDDSVPDSV